MPAIHAYEKALVDGVWSSDVLRALQPEWELYNVVVDPSEQINLIEQRPELAARMRAQLDAWNESVDRSIKGADYPEGWVLPSGREN